MKYLGVGVGGVDWGISGVGGGGLGDIDMNLVLWIWSTPYRTHYHNKVPILVLILTYFKVLIALLMPSEVLVLVLSFCVLAPTRDHGQCDCPYFVLRSIKSTVSGAQVDNFHKVVCLMDKAPSQNLLWVPELKSCSLKIWAYLDAIHC